MITAVKGGSTYSGGEHNAKTCESMMLKLLKAHRWDQLEDEHVPRKDSTLLFGF
jgi:hypothetical protein